MRRLFLSLLTIGLVASGSVNAGEAGTLTLAFDRGISVIQLLQATYRHLLGKNYILDPALAGDTRVVTLSVKDLPADQLKSTVDSILRESGIASKDLGGIYYFYPIGKVAVSGGLGTLQEGVQAAPEASRPPTIGAMPTVIPGAMSGHPGMLTPTDYEETRFLDPRFRIPDQLQTMANTLLGTAFPASDKVVLAGSLERVERVQKLLEQYDTIPGEIIAKALVFEFSDSKSEGSSFQLALNILAGKLTLGLGGSVSPGDNFVRWKNTSVDAVLAAVSGDGRFKLVSAPSIRVRDGSKGRLTVGQEVPVLAEAQLDKNGNPIQSVQYRPSGVIFDLAPRIMRDRIELTLSQQLSNFIQTSTSKINSPTLTKREVSTVVGIDSGDMIVLGGLDETRDNETRQGLSFLPRFLDTTKTETSKSQVLVVLQVSRVQTLPEGSL